MASPPGELSVLNAGEVKVGEAPTVVGAGSVSMKLAAPTAPAAATGSPGAATSGGADLEAARLIAHGKRPKKAHRSHRHGDSDMLIKSIKRLEAEKAGLIEALNQVAKLYEESKDRVEVLEALNGAIEPSDDEADDKAQAAADPSLEAAAKGVAEGSSAEVDGVESKEWEGSTEVVELRKSERALRKEVRRLRLDVAQRRVQIRVLTQERIKMTREIQQLKKDLQTSGEAREQAVHKLKLRNKKLASAGKEVVGQTSAERDALLTYAQTLETENAALKDAAREGIASRDEIAAVRAALAEERQRAELAEAALMKTKHELDWLKSQPGPTPTEAEARAMRAEGENRHLMAMVSKLRSGAHFIYEARTLRVEQQLEGLVSRMRTLESELGSFMEGNATVAAAQAAAGEVQPGLPAHDIARLERRISVAAADMATAEARLLLRKRNRDRTREEAQRELSSGLPFGREIKKLVKKIDGNFYDVAVVANGAEVSLRTVVDGVLYFLNFVVPGEEDAPTDDRILAAAKVRLDSTTVREDGVLRHIGPEGEWVTVSSVPTGTRIVPPGEPRPLTSFDKKDNSEPPQGGVGGLFLLPPPGAVPPNISSILRSASRSPRPRESPSTTLSPPAPAALRAAPPTDVDDKPAAAAVPRPPPGPAPVEDDDEGAAETAPVPVPPPTDDVASKVASPKPQRPQALPPTSTPPPEEPTGPSEVDLKTQELGKKVADISASRDFFAGIARGEDSATAQPGTAPAPDDDM